MRKRRLSKALAMFLAAALTIPAAVPVAASESTADKEETVYVKTDANGEEKTASARDWLKNFSGEAKIKDATDLTDVENVKGNETYKRGKKDSITWNANGKDIYYQGTSDKNLPVSMKVTYYLDGKEISPKKLVGKSGKVKIRYEYENHSAVTKTINGKQTTVYTPFTMITAAILNTDNFSNVKATNGKVISDGNKHIVIGVAMPGLADSLNLKNTSIGSNFDIPEDFEITADVEDFQMTVTATVANSDTLSEFGLDDAGDLSELTDSLKDLENATDKLCDGSGDLEVAQNIIEVLEQEEIARLNKQIPAFGPGDTVAVSVTIRDGDHTRVQVYEGVVIAKRNRGLNSSFTVRKISSGEGVERTFQTYSPLVSAVEVKRRGAVRRAKLYYLRDRAGKTARIRERLVRKNVEKAE